MWFKQLSFYPVSTEKLPDAPTLAAKLGEAAFAPITGLERTSEGFAAPHGFSPEPVFPAGHTWGIALKKAEKVLPAAVVREILDERIAEIQNAEARSIGRKEKQEMKEQITDELLPKAFVRSSLTQAVCDTQRGFLLIGSASANRAENLLSKLREALGGLEARLPHTQKSPAALMTEWLASGECAGGFELDDSCELKGQGDVVPTVKITKQDLTAEEVRRHLETGKTATQLGLVWREQIAFVLADNFTLKRIRYLDIMQEEAEAHDDDAASLAFAEQTLMAQGIGEMLEELAAHLGGWQAA